MKTKTVHFYVQREFVSSTANAVIRFDVAPVNEGNAFNLAAGIFTALVNWIYHFQLSAVKDESATYLEIRLQVNGATVGSTYTFRPTTECADDVVSLSASLRLAAGDTVRLYNMVNSRLFDDSNHKTHFTGWLVEQDFV